jgi:hypothetical protein
MPPEEPDLSPTAGPRAWLARPVPALLAVAALVIAGALVIPHRPPAPLDTSTGSVPAGGEPGAPAPPPPVTGWVPLPATALTFSEGSPTVAAAGREVVVLYAENAADEAGIAGYRIDLAAGRAAPVAPAPLEWRAQPATVWTGHEVIVVGGSSGRGIRTAGAAYDPALDRWRVIAPPPGFRTKASAYGLTGPAVWAGDRMVIWNAGLAYDPAADRWDGIAPAPLTSRTDEAVAATPEGILVWGGCESGVDECGEQARSWFTDGAWYDLATDRWTLLPPAPLAAARSARAVAAGGVVHVVAGSGLAAWDPRAAAWRPEADLPAPLPAGSTFTATGAPAAGSGVQATQAGPGVQAPPARIVVVGRRVAVAYDPAADRWAPLVGDAPNRQYHAAVWTGADLVIAGGVPDGRPLAYRPPPR